MATNHGNLISLCIILAPLMEIEHHKRLQSGEKGVCSTELFVEGRHIVETNDGLRF